ncbi:MAG: hypothetical protein JWM16_416 [Verrucomicrobiales bacterium]|nr:hypothetical protein [Verrucomicrobiales bacterium]
MKPLDAAKWIRHFQSNRYHRPEPDWSSPIRLQPVVIQKLLPSIEQFQLGDGGGPASLIARDAEAYRNSSEDTKVLTDLWFTEEREHSRLLGEAVRRLHGQSIRSHWSFSAFCACRRLISVRAELQILLLTELVSTAYYKVLRRHVDDQPLKDMCALILRDEAGHVAYHRDRLAAHATGKGLLWVLQFWLCGYAAATMLWINHGPCLHPLGARRREYFQEVRFQISRFVHSLFRSEVTSGECRTEPAKVYPGAAQAA